MRCDVVDESAEGVAVKEADRKSCCVGGNTEDAERFAQCRFRKIERFSAQNAFHCRVQRFIVVTAVQKITEEVLACIVRIKCPPYDGGITHAGAVTARKQIVKRRRVGVHGISADRSVQSLPAVLAV